MNCVVAGRPAGTTLAVAGALRSVTPAAPVTLLSDDTAGLLAALDRPELAGCEVLWADAAVPSTVDDALVHRRMLHGRPDVVLVVVDRSPADGSTAWTFGELLAPRLAGTPLVVTGLAAAGLAGQVADVLRGTDGDRAEPPHVVVPGDDAAEILRRTTEFLRSLPEPATEPAASLLAGHCGH